jgi:hypothetical protein
MTLHRTSRRQRARRRWTHRRRPPARSRALVVIRGRAGRDGTSRDDLLIPIVRRWHVRVTNLLSTCQSCRHAGAIAVVTLLADGAEPD